MKAHQSKGEPPPKESTIKRKGRGRKKEVGGKATYAHNVNAPIGVKLSALTERAIIMENHEPKKHAGGEGVSQDAIHIPNVEKLMDYINSQDNPERFANLLLSFAKPSANKFTNRQKKM